MTKFFLKYEKSVELSDVIQNLKYLHLIYDIIFVNESKSDIYTNKI